jgi:hypothetical protein
MGWLFIILLFGFILFIMTRRFSETKHEAKGAQKELRKFSPHHVISQESVIDNDAQILSEDHLIDIGDAERMLDIMDEYGVDEDTALELIDEL